MIAAAGLTVDRDSAAQRRFENAASVAGYDPDDRWVDGYARYEWDHLRPVLAAYGIEVAGRDVLEFGCNVGGSTVVLAALGATLSAVDIDPLLTPITEANLARHGLTGTIRLARPGEALPFIDASFDLVLANSVLEYVEPDRLETAIAELHRLLRPDGLLFICGTASRLALRERHSGRWLVNYLPRAVDRLAGRPLQRGLAPWRLARLLKGRFIDISGCHWLAARQAIHKRTSWPLRT
jgi:SAM-dependent methyltransferase